MDLTPHQPSFSIAGQTRTVGCTQRSASNCLLAQRLAPESEHVCRIALVDTQVQRGPKLSCNFLLYLLGLASGS